MVKPKFVDEVREDGIPIRKFQTEVINPSLCSKTTLIKAQDMLKGVCIRGTGKNLKNRYYTIAGKTGTAVIANEDKGYVNGGAKKYQASFCGYFPADNPKYSCIVVIVGPQGAFYGGSVAGPVFRGIARSRCRFNSKTQGSSGGKTWRKGRCDAFRSGTGI
jgi:cell division protein FtsI (penicillin-binding protein 3)